MEYKVCDSDNIEKIVAKIDGDTKGNAILINKKQAITVRHCVNNERVKLVFTKLYKTTREVWAKIDLQDVDVDDPLVLLELEEEVAEINVTFASVRLRPMDDALVYGYDANYLAEGCWINIKSTASYIADPNLKNDMQFDILHSRERGFSGLSGSPIVKKGRVIGIISQEKIEDSQAISIYGISVRSCSIFFNKYNIPVLESQNEGEYTFEPKYSIGDYGQKNNTVSTADIKELQSKMQGMYRDKLSDIMSMHRNGNIDRAWADLKRQIAEFDKEPFINSEVKAEYYYMMALWFLNDRNDIGRAQKKYEMALKLKPDLDDCIFQTLKQSMMGECKNAEELLEPVDSVDKFNIYLQVCINTHKIQKGYTKYEELDQIITMDATTYYLLSIVEIMLHRYDAAEEHIENALALDRNIPNYHLVKGIVFYWRALPGDVCVEEDLYPVMFTNGLFHMDDEKHQMLKTATEEYRKAYQLAENVNNEEQMEVILSIWINTLSVDSSFQEEIMEPLQLQKAKNPFNVTMLLYMLQRKMVLDNEITLENLERHLGKSQNKIGSLIVLIEFCLSKNDKKNAKRILHKYRSVFFNDNHYEYWYEYIIEVENKKDKLALYEEEIRKDTELEETRKRRLLCLFIQLDEERNQELEAILIQNYQQTENRLDLLNLITYYKARRNWKELLRYADILITQYNDAYGNIYRIQCLIELQEYERALGDIEELENKSICGTEKELLQDKMIVCEKKGDFDAAIVAGKKLLQKKPNEQTILKVASLYALNGNETASLNILLTAENNSILSIGIYQRISLCYLTIDQRKAWEYAEKAVKLSNNQPEIMLWAANIANNIGKSEKASEYYHNIMIKNHDHHLMKIRTIDEILEMITSSSNKAVKRQEMLYNGELVSHLYVDTTSSNQTYAEFFYSQWNENKLIPIEFGAHCYSDDMLNIDIKKIVLDYSSCLLLHELGILDILCNNLEKVYIAGTLFGVISEELRKIPVNQPDLIRLRYELMKKCQEETNIKFIDVKSPDNVAQLDAVEYANTVSQYTAEYYTAEWVSDDGVESSIREIEVIVALFRNGKISQEALEVYKRENWEAREEMVRKIEKATTLYIDYDVLLKWEKACFINAVCEKYVVLINKNILEESEKEYNQIARKEHICKQLTELRNLLLNQKDKGKIKFLPISEQIVGMDYSNMLYSSLAEAEKRELPVCLDDRVLTSYSNAGKSVIYNSLDIMKILFNMQKVNLEQYSTIYKTVIDKRIRYILPDIHYILYAMTLSEVDYESGMLKESDMLSGIRKYVVEAFAEGSYLRKKAIEHVQIPEWEYYVFHLQGHSRDLIHLIWQSNMECDKKIAASEWTLCYYSQFVFDYSDQVNEETRKTVYAIQLADFLLAGMLFGKEEKSVEQYYMWLYEWFDNYLRLNPDIKINTLEYAKQFIVSAICDAKRSRTKQEYFIIKLMFATGLYYMPDEYKNYFLMDEEISGVYSTVYCRISVVLTNELCVPVKLFESWQRDVLIQNENEILTRTYQDVSFAISWEYILPGLPALSINWKEGEIEFTKKLLFNKGARLKHEKRDVRKKEFKYIEPYLEEMEYGKPYLALQGQGKYEDAAEEILKLLDTSEKYAKARIEKGLKDGWLGMENTRRLMLPYWPNFFLRLYNFEMGIGEVVNIKNDIAVSIPLQFGAVLEKQKVNNHNPVRLLHKLESLFFCNSGDEEILAIIELLFSYADNETTKYGKIYILFLKYVWYILKEMNNYTEEPQENHIIWTYIWTDYMMTALIKLEQEANIDVSKLSNRLEEDIGIDLKTEGFWDSVEKEDIICPAHMNLFRLCVMGTLLICNRHEKRMRYMAPKILDMLGEKYDVWMQLPIYVRELELLHKNDINTFNSIFTNNAYVVIEQLASTGECRDKIGLGEYGESIDNNVQIQLRKMAQREEVKLSDIKYLVLISRESMEETQTEMIKKLIEEQILGKDFQTDVVRLHFLSLIVKKLPEDFQRKYVHHESKRLGKLLHLRKVNWKEAYELAGVITRPLGMDSFLTFWEMYAEELDALSALQVAQKIGLLQRGVPYEYGNRVRKLRLRLELRDH